jgi:hypothetical protein
MHKSKSQMTCSYCSKIFKNPIVLPCGDFICRYHLKERDVVKQNKFKCKKCNDKFSDKTNRFKSNNELTRLIEIQCYFSHQEMGLKQELEASIRQFFELHDEFVHNKIKPNRKCLLIIKK